jgi:hypothetical protein
MTYYHWMSDVDENIGPYSLGATGRADDFYPETLGPDCDDEDWEALDALFSKTEQELLFMPDRESWNILRFRLLG